MCVEIALKQHSEYTIYAGVICTLVIIALFYAVAGSYNVNSGMEACVGCGNLAFSSNSQSAFTITLSVANSTQPANGQLDLLTATVYFLGAPYQGATVNFTSPQSFPKIQPLKVVTNSNGIATAYISSTTAGKATVFANFSSYSANVAVTFSNPLKLTFNASTSGASGSVVVINGVTYSTSQLPVSVYATPGERFTYYFESSVGTGGTMILGPSASGCGVTGQSNVITASYNCTVVATYSGLYYELTLAANPSNGGSPTCASGCYQSIGGGSYWAAADGSVTVDANPSSTGGDGVGYASSGWSGPLYSGGVQNPSFSITEPATETADYYAITTSTTSTISTTSTSTAPTTSPTTTASSGYTITMVPSP